jgi:hypothetical protein
MFDAVRSGVIVVAHCDDETLWCGGLMARHLFRWTVISCSIPRTDPIRAYKFFEACESLGAKARLLPFVEAEPHMKLGNLDRLDLSEFDVIVTHNRAGEYGHRHHVDVHEHITGHWPERTWCIGYGINRHDVAIDLTAGEQLRKREALRCYDHVSPTDGKPKWEALIERYGKQFDLSVETYASFAG